MARTKQYQDLTYATTRPTFIGRPVEAIQQTNALLDKRWHTNKAAYDNQIQTLSQLDVEKQNQGIVEDQVQSTEDMFKSTIATNDFEHSDLVVSDAVKEVINNKSLKGAVQSKVLRDTYFKGLDESTKAGKLDQATNNRLRSEAAAMNYRKIEVGENGEINNMFSANAAVEDPDINKLVSDEAAKLKASSKPIGVTLKNGQVKHMRHERGAWYYTGQTESIPEAEATANITALIEQDPKVKAWLGQKKRLDNLDIVVKNDDGTFKFDENDNLIYDLNQVDMNKKVLSLGIDPAVVLAQNAAIYGTPTDMGSYTKEQQNQILKAMYDQYYNRSQIQSRAASAVGIVDYTKETLKFHQDQMYIERMKRKWKKEDDALLIANLPRISVTGKPSNNMAMDIGELGKNVSSAKETLEARNKTLQNAARQAGFSTKDQTVIVSTSKDASGNDVYSLKLISTDVNGKKLITDVNESDKQGLVFDEYLTNYVSAKKNYEIKEAEFNTLLKHAETADPGFKAKLAKWGTTDKRILDDETLKEFEKKGYFSNDSGFFTPVTIGDNLTSLGEKHVDEILKAMRENNSIEFTKFTSKIISDFDGVTNDRFSAIRKQDYDKTSTVYTGVVVDGKQPGTKLIYGTMEADVKLNHMGATDLLGNSISENESGKLGGITQNKVNELLASKDLTYVYTTDGGKPEIMVSSSIGEGDESESITIRVPTNTNYTSYLQTEPEQTYSEISSRIIPAFAGGNNFETFTYNAGVVVEENGQMVSHNQPIKITRVPIDSDGNIIPEGDNVPAKAVGRTYLIEGDGFKGTNDNIHRVVDLISNLKNKNKYAYNLTKTYTEKPVQLYPYQTRVTPQY